MSFRHILLFLSVTIFSLAHALEDIGPRTDYFKIDRIEVSGLKKVEKEAVLERLGVKPDMVLDNYVLKKDLEKILKIGYLILKILSWFTLIR